MPCATWLELGISCSRGPGTRPAGPLGPPSLSRQDPARPAPHSRRLPLSLFMAPFQVPSSPPVPSQCPLLAPSRCHGPHLREAVPSGCLLSSGRTCGLLPPSLPCCRSPLSPEHALVTPGTPSPQLSSLPPPPMPPPARGPWAALHENFLEAEKARQGGQGTGQGHLTPALSPPLWG